MPDAESRRTEPHPRRTDETPRAGGIGIQIDRIWRYRLLVAAITLIATIAGVAAAASASTQYTASAVLSAASPTRTNDDASLAQGYVFVFNQPAFQTSLSQRTKVTDVTTFGAHTAGLG